MNENDEVMGSTNLAQIQKCYYAGKLLQLSTSDSANLDRSSVVVSLLFSFYQ